MKSLKINALASVSVKVLNILFPLVTGPYIARTLSKDNISIFDSANTLLQLFIPFAGLGIYTYGVREISKIKNHKEKINKLFSELFYLSLVSSLVTFMIYYIYSSYFVNSSNHLIYYVISIQILAQCIYIEWLNEAFENYTFILYKTLAVRLITFVLIFTFIKGSNDILAYAAIMTTSEVLNSLLSFIWIKKDVKLVKVNIKHMLKILMALVTIFLLANVNMLYIFLDRIFLTKVPVATYISDYVLAFNIVMIIMGVMGGLIGVNTPRLSYYLGINNHTAYEDLLNKGSKAFLFFVIPICFGLMILGTDASLIYGGEKFLSAGIVTSIFAIRAIAWSLDAIIGIQILFVKGYEKMLTFFLLIGGIINLALNYTIFSQGIYKPEYYILTTLIAETIVLLMYIIFIMKNKIVKLNHILKAALKYALMASLFFLINYLINQIIPPSYTINKDTILSITVKILLCSTSYILALLITKDDILSYMIWLIKNKLQKKDVLH